MDWTTIVMTLLGGTSALAIFDAIRFRKQNESLKTSEAKVAVTDTQSQQIDLADKYLEKVLALTEKGNASSEAILQKVDEVHKEVVVCRNDINSITRYLNGGYKEFLRGESDSDPC